MEKTTIGYNAGAIWDKLRETGRIPKIRNYHPIHD